MQELVRTKMELAELHESYLKARNAAHKAHEKNLQVCAKMTKLENILYSHAQAKPLRQTAAAMAQH